MLQRISFVGYNLMELFLYHSDCLEEARRHDRSNRSGSKRGFLMVSDPDFRGKKFTIALSEREKTEYERDTDWEAIKAIVQQADSLNFPRKTHEEITRDIREIRG